MARVALARMNAAGATPCGGSGICGNGASAVLLENGRMAAPGAEAFPMLTAAAFTLTYRSEADSILAHDGIPELPVGLGAGAFTCMVLLGAMAGEWDNDTADQGPVLAGEGDSDIPETGPSSSVLRPPVKAESLSISARLPSL